VHILVIPEYVSQGRVPDYFAGLPSPACLPASGILTTWTRIGKIVNTCLNMVQTCMYRFTRLYTLVNMYVHGMYMYINIYKCTYMFMNSYLCMYVVHTHAKMLIYVWILYRHEDTSVQLHNHTSFPIRPNQPCNAC
jgi:hypothetical protein